MTFMPSEVTCECGGRAVQWYDGEHVSLYRCEGGHNALRYASTGRVQRGTALQYEGKRDKCQAPS